MTMADPATLDPARTALLAMDYQAGIVGRIPGADALLTTVDAVTGTLRARGGHVGWVRVGFDDDDLAAIPTHSVMAGMTAPDRGEDFHADSPATQLDRRLHPQPEDIVVRKTRVGAFTTTDLGSRLRQRGVDTLVLAGISTSGVVLSTVREAMDRDYRIVVIADLCADPDADTHRFLTGRLFPRHTIVVTADALSGLGL
jgi:nicotinamidase-related amidase